MKIREISTSETINEGVMDTAKNWLLRKGALGTQRALQAQTEYLDQTTLKTYVSDLQRNFDKAVSSGQITDTSAAAPAAAAGAGTPAAPAASAATAKTPATATAGTTGPAAGRLQKQAVPSAGQKQTSQNINNYVRNIATTLNAEKDKNKKMALAKELVNFMADRKNYPEWENAVATAQQVIKRGIPDPNFSNSAINRLKSGQMMESWQYYWINKLLESTKLTFKQLGLTVLRENSKDGKFVLIESKSRRVSKLLESTRYLIENPGMTAGQWVKKYIEARTMGYDMDPGETDRLANLFQQQWDETKKFPSDAATKIVQSMMSMASIQKRDKYGDVQADKPAQQQTTGASGGAASTAGAPEEQPAAPKVSTSGIKPDDTLPVIATKLQRGINNARVVDEALVAIMKYVRDNNPDRYTRMFGGTKAAAAVEKMYPSGT